MKLLGIVILYYPPKDIMTNINSYIDVLNELIIWDNTPGGCRIDSPGKENIRQMGINENVGIGTALNEAVKYATANGFTHLLTMDQDSGFVDEDCNKYIDIIKQANLQAIFAPNYLIHGQKLYEEQISFIETETTMTSGSIYPVNIFDKIGLFREDFFIDAIDIEFCLRAKQNGIPTLIIPAVYLSHQAGYQKKKYKFLWKTFYPNEYSAERSYYIVRNGLVSKKLYPYAEYWKGYLYYWFYKRIFFVILYENHKLSKLKGLIRGYIHGKKEKTGKQPLF